MTGAFLFRILDRRFSIVSNPWRDRDIAGMRLEINQGFFFTCPCGSVTLLLTYRIGKEFVADDDLHDYQELSWKMFLCKTKSNQRGFDPILGNEPTDRLARHRQGGCTSAQRGRVGIF